MSESPFASRPEPPQDAREGFHWEAVQDGPEWVAPPVGAGRCRYIVGRRSCKKPAAATLMRPVWARKGSKPQPWDYCAEHLYGRWIEDGAVMSWRLVADGEAE